MKTDEGKRKAEKGSSGPRPLQASRFSLLTSLNLIVLVAAVIAVIIIRVMAAPAPLERDEGEYALMGQLILDGTPPYSEAANMKLPGIYYAYSALMSLFGQTAAGIHMGLLAVNLLSTVLLYLVALPLIGSAGAVFAAISFIIMSADISVLGLFAHATHFVMMFSLAGTLLLQKNMGATRRTWLLFASGICFGIGILMKQSGALFAVFAFLWFLKDALGRRPVLLKSLLFESACLAGGIMLPYCLVMGLMAYQGVFDRFWFWTVDYARAYASEVDLKTGIELFNLGITPIIKNNPAIWIMVLAGSIGIWFTKEGRKSAPFLALFFVFSFISVCPGFFFRHHYFVQLLPAAALYAGAALLTLERAAAPYTAKSKVLQSGAMALVTAISLTGVFSTGRALANSTPAEFSRSVYGANPFPESQKIAEYIKDNTNQNDRIAVIGSEPQICFYAHRKSATEHIYMYGLMEAQPFALRMQEEMIEEVEKSEPAFLVLAAVSTSWLRRPESNEKIFSWLGNYIGSCYQPVMIADIYADRTIWLTGIEAQTFRPGAGSSQIILFKRKAAR